MCINMLHLLGSSVISCMTCCVYIIVLGYLLKAYDHMRYHLQRLQKLTYLHLFTDHFTYFSPSIRTKFDFEKQIVQTIREKYS